MGAFLDQSLCSCGRSRPTGLPEEACLNRLTFCVLPEEASLLLQIMHEKGKIAVKSDIGCLLVIGLASRDSKALISLRVSMTSNLSKAIKSLPNSLELLLASFFQENGRGSKIAKQRFTSC